MTVTSRSTHVATMARRLVQPTRGNRVTNATAKSLITRSFSNQMMSSSWLPSATNDTSSSSHIKLQQRDFFWSKKDKSSSAITEEKVRDLFYKWNSALATLDPKTVANLYSKKNTILLPTVSDTPRTDYDGLVDYFTSFLQVKPQGKIVNGKITIGEDWAMDCGIYEFTMGATGAKVMARYSYVYAFEDGDWKIAHHHSSVLPEGIVKPQPITKEEVQGLFHVWNNALATLDSKTVTDVYSKNAVLLPTVSDTPRTNYAMIKDYFDAFLKVKPQGVIVQSNVYIGANWAQDAGIYEFTMGATGVKVMARYTFIYVFEDGKWKIQHHHSSVMPEKIPAAAQPITKEEVRGLFSLWNNALATLDPDTVAKRYSKAPVLLPTVSNTPRTDYALIKDYFTNFLKLKPQGKIVSGDIVIGHNWAQDCGIYDFTMGANGSEVRARYSFVYVYEDGEWKISHHHSSVMPEK